jgi:hypothetical protein
MPWSGANSIDELEENKKKMCYIIRKLTPTIIPKVNLIAVIIALILSSTLSRFSSVKVISP